MKTFLTLMALVALALTLHSIAQDASTAAPAPAVEAPCPCAGVEQAQEAGGTNTSTAPAQTGTPDAKPTTEELEAKFKAMLTNAQLVGRWCSLQNGVLGPDKEDKYNIQSVAKISSDTWTVFARIQYGQRDIVAPIAVQVRWAGDTAVLSVDKLTIPGGNSSYTARVLFYENTYSGTWSGGDHGGLLHGIITHPKPTNASPETITR